MFKIVITQTTCENHSAGEIKNEIVESKVYEQVLENINLEAVILAVNGMPHQNCVH